MDAYAYLNIHIYTLIHVCKYIHICIYIYVHIYTCMYTYVRLFVCVYIHIFFLCTFANICLTPLQVCDRMAICTCGYMHIYTYFLYTHIYECLTPLQVCDRAGICACMYMYTYFLYAYIWMPDSVAGMRPYVYMRVCVYVYIHISPVPIYMNAWLRCRCATVREVTPAQAKMGVFSQRYRWCRLVNIFECSVHMRRGRTCSHFVTQGEILACAESATVLLEYETWHVDPADTGNFNGSSIWVHVHVNHTLRLSAWVDPSMHMSALCNNLCSAGHAPTTCLVEAHIHTAPTPHVLLCPHLTPTTHNLLCPPGHTYIYIYVCMHTYSCT